MEKLRVLILIYIILIAISIVTGVGVYLIVDKYAYAVCGAMLIASSFIATVLLVMLGRGES